MATKEITLDPRRRDRLANAQGEAYEACGPTRKAIQAATGHSKTWVHECVKGDRSGLLRDIDKFERGRESFRTTAMPIIGRALAVLLEARREVTCLQQLAGNALRGCVQETSSQGHEDNHQQRVVQRLSAAHFQGVEHLTLPQLRGLIDDLREYEAAAQTEVDHQLDLLVDVRLLREGLEARSIRK